MVLPRWHSPGKDKTKFIELYLFQRHAHVLRYFHLNFICALACLFSVGEFFFLLMLSNFCGHIYQYTVCIQVGST